MSAAVAYPTLEVTQDAPLWLARNLYEFLPNTTKPGQLTDEQMDVVERIAIQVQSCGLTDMEGKLVKGAVAR